MADDIDLRRQMTRAALLIIRSVDFAEKQINAKIKELELAQLEFRDDDGVVIEKQIQSLIVRLNKELTNMDKFMVKYDSIIKKAEQDAKKKVLPNSR